MAKDPEQPESAGAVSYRRLLARMSEREKTLLKECCEYAICTVGKEYYRLGGHGHVPLRYHDATLYKLQKLGLVENHSYWKATQKGQDLMRANA